MKLSLLFAATSALLVENAFADQAGDCPHGKCNKKPNWEPPCDDHPHHHSWPATYTKYHTVYLEPETVCVTSTRTYYQTRTTDGVVRFTSSTSVSTTRQSTTVTSTTTSYKTIATSTRTVTKTLTIPRPRNLLPGKDTVFGYPEYEHENWKRDVAEVAAEVTEAAEAVPKGEKNEWPEHHDHHHGHKPVIVEVVVTATPKCKTTTHWNTVTRTSKYVPTTISVIDRFTRTATIIDRVVRTATTTLPKTATLQTTTTTTYYAACATNNIILTGPDGHTITNVFNNGKHRPSTYDLLPGTYRSPYDCCAACQSSRYCTGSVFRASDNKCLLLHRRDRQCGPQCENEAVYVTDPNSRGAGLVVSNGPCGYQKWGGHSKHGVVKFGTAIAGRVEEPGL